MPQPRVGTELAQLGPAGLHDAVPALAERMPHERPQMTIFAIAFTSGVLLAMAAHILAGHIGVAFVPNWASWTAPHDELVRSALGWWMIAAAGFLGSFIAGLLLRDAPGQARRRGMLLRLAGLALFVTLAALPLAATGTPPAGLSQTLLINLTAFALGTATAFCGGWFSLRT